MAEKEKYHNITEHAFSFIKYRCRCCGKIMKLNENFCSIECKTRYFFKMSVDNTEISINKKKQSKRHVHKMSDILSEENLKAMVDDVEKNIDTRMNKSRR